MLRSKLAGLLFLLVIVSMSVWGIDDIFTSNSGNLLKAGDRSISMIDFEEDVQNQLQDLSRQQGRAVTAAEAVENGLIDQMFTQQASSLIVLGYGESIGARASTTAVTAQVLEQEAFNSTLTGKFDSEVYEDVLRRNRLSPSEFEQDIRDSLTRSYVFDAAGTAVEPPSAFVDLISKFQGEARSVSFIKIGTDDVTEIPSPTDEELKEFFETNKPTFSEPERRGITVLNFSPEDFRQSVEITEEQLVAAYDRAKERFYSTPETRNFVEATFDSEAAALQALGTLAAGGDPATLENVLSTEEKITQRDLLDSSAFADAVFALAEGAVTEPLEDQGIWKIARVNEILPGTPYPFEDVRDQVRDTLITEYAQTAFEDAARNLRDLKGEGLSLREIGERLGAPAISYIPVDRQGTSANRTLVLDLVSRYPEALRGTAELFEDEITDRFDSEDGSIYLGELDSIVSASTPEFEDVKDRVRVAWQARNRNDAVELYAASLARQIDAGETTLAAEASRLGKTITKVSRPLTRAAPGNEIPGPAAAAVFSANQAGSVVSAPTNKADEHLILSIDSIEPPTEQTVEAMRTSVRSALTTQLDSDLRSALGPAIEGAVELEQNIDALNAYKNRNARQQ